MSVSGNEVVDQQASMPAELLSTQTDEQVEAAAFRLKVAKLVGVSGDEVLADFRVETVPVVEDRTGQYRRSQLDVIGVIDGINGRREGSYCFDHTVETPEFMSDGDRRKLGRLAIYLADTQRIVLSAPRNRKFE